MPTRRRTASRRIASSTAGVLATRFADNRATVNGPGYGINITKDEDDNHVRLLERRSGRGQRPQQHHLFLIIHCIGAP